MNSDAQSKIIIISPTESVLTKRGNRHPVLAEKLACEGYEVLYLTTDFYHAEKRRFAKEEIRNALKSIPYKIKFFRSISYDSNISINRFIGNIKSAFSMFLFLLKHGQKADVLLIPSRPPEFVFVASLLKRLKGLSVIVDVRDVWPDGLPLKDKWSHKVFWNYCNLVYFLSAKPGSIYVYTAPGFLNWIKKFGAESHSSFIPIGFDGDRWQCCTVLKDADLGPVINLVYVGDLARTMNIAPIFQAVAGHNRFTLTFIGGGEQLDEIKSAVKKTNVSNIFFKGFIPKDQVVVELQHMHVTVIPMDAKYVMPNKLFDALGSFRPVLVFGENDAASFVEENNIGWSLPFAKDAAMDFLEGLTTKDILVKSENISKIRGLYTKEFLYKGFMELITRGFPT